MAIEVGATLNTFEEFRKALSDFQINNNVLFVTKATKKVEVVNARLSVGLERLDSKLKYANATYICKHGGVKRCSGTGFAPSVQAPRDGKDNANVEVQVKSASTYS